MNQLSVKRGDIFYADLSPVIGSEQGGVRPVLVVQNDVGNRYSPTVITSALTSQVKNSLPTHIEIRGAECGLSKDSIILLEQIRTIDKKRLREKAGHVPDGIMEKVDEILNLSLGIREVKPMNELRLFNYNGIQGVRVIATSGNDTMFVARDICDILELGDTSKAVSRLPSMMKGTNSIPTPGGNQDMLTVTEAGLYKLIFTSRKPEAEKFTDWLALEVIPAIRKHGAYIAVKDSYVIEDPIERAKAWIREQEQKKRLEKQVEQDKPKVLFADAVSASSTSILIGELAKLLRQNGIEVGQNRLFEELRSKGYLIKRVGSDWNMPTQKSMELGLFEIKEHTHIDGNGCNITTKTTKVTGKGQQYFINKFLVKSAWRRVRA